MSFVFIRATAGIDKKDVRFDENWKNSKKHKFIRGAYHYYRQNKNSIKKSLEYAAKNKYSNDIRAAIFFMYTYPLKVSTKCNDKIYMRLSIPNAIKKLVEKVIFNLSELKQFQKLKPRQVLDLIYKMDLFRNPDILPDEI